MNWLAEGGVAEKGSGDKNTVTKRFDGRVCRVLALKMESLEEPDRPKDEMEQQGFTEVDPADGDLPF
jgi:hypothetical protein